MRGRGAHSEWDRSRILDKRNPRPHTFNAGGKKGKQTAARSVVCGVPEDI